MLKYRLLLQWLLVILIFEQLPPIAGAISSSLTSELSPGASFTFTIAPGLPEFSFKIIPDLRKADEYGNHERSVRDIEVFRGKSQRPLQHLTGCHFEETEPPPPGLHWYHTDDFNFDGYEDIYLLKTWGATGNTYGCVWLYNPATGRFDFSDDFSDLSQISLDPETKTISTFETGGMTAMVYVAAKYKVEKNHVLLIRSKSQDWDETRKQFHCTMQQRRGTGMVTVRDEWGAYAPCDSSELF